MKILIIGTIVTTLAFCIGYKLGKHSEFKNNRNFRIEYSKHEIDSTTFRDSLYIVTVRPINREDSDKLKGCTNGECEYFWRDFIYDRNSNSDDPVGVIDIYKRHPEMGKIIWEQVDVFDSEKRTPGTAVVIDPFPDSLTKSKP